MADKKVRMAPELQEKPGATADNIVTEDRDVKAEQAAKGHDLDEQHKREVHDDAKGAAAKLAATEDAKEAALATKAARAQARQEYLQTPLTPAEVAELGRLEKQAMANRNVPAETMYRLSDLRVRARVPEPGTD